MDNYVELLSEAFLGKICTILTAATPLPVKDGVQHSQYFTGEVRRIDRHGVWVRHLTTGTMSFFGFPLVGIVEEQHVAPDDPRYVKLKEDVQKQKAAEAKKPQAARKPPLPPNFMNVDELLSKTNPRAT